MDRHAKARHIQQIISAVEQTQHHAFTICRRQRADAHINRAIAKPEGGSAILRHQAFRHIHAANDFDATNQRTINRWRYGMTLVQHAVDAVTNQHLVSGGLDMQIAGAHLHRRKQ